MKKPTKKRWLLLLCLLFLTADQLTKALTIANLKAGESVGVIKSFFRITYVQNKGVTFGMLQNTNYIMLPLIALTIAAILFLLLSGRVKNKVYFTGLSFIAAGACGNLIDRIKYGYVIDMIDFHAIWSYIFNIADSLIVCSVTAILAYEVITVCKSFKKGENVE